MNAYQSKPWLKLYPDNLTSGMAMEYRDALARQWKLNMVVGQNASVLADKLTSPAQVVLLLAMSVVCFCFSEWGWRTSMRRYTSASS